MIAAALCAVLCLASPSAAPAQPLPAPLVPGVTPIGSYDLPRLQRIGAGELDDFMRSSTQPTAFRGRFAPPRYPVRLYKIIYESRVPEHGDSPTLASGLIAIPETGRSAMPVVAYQHGTVFDKDAVPSRPDQSMETRLVLLQHAAQGSIVIAADYFGRGDSTLPDSYLVRDSTRQAGLDFLRAALKAISDQGITTETLFLSGWSQGGWVTMQDLRQFEAAGIPVAAAAVASAPVDIFLTMNRWLNNPQPVDAVYLPGVVALQLQAQEAYGGPKGLTASAILPQYLQVARGLYEGRVSWEQFAREAPPRLDDLIRQDFRLGGFVGAGEYWERLRDAEAYLWRTRTPLRVYFGGRDEVTPKPVAMLPEATQSLLGGASVSTIDAGPDADHRAIFVFGLLDQAAWFASLR